MSPAQSDDLLSGRYRLRTVIGRGGMGVVWLADDELLHRDVAVKETIWPAHLDEAEQAKLRQRALREARTAAALDHPNIVKVFDVVEDDGRPWMVMQLVPFRSLGDIVRDDGPLSPAQTAQIGLRLLNAIEAAHAAGVLHRDIKPGNVLLGPDGRVVLTDFGLAVADGSPDLTTSGLILGSPAYMAPERALGEDAGPPADLWSLGATLYAAVEGRDAFRRGGAMAVLTAIVTAAPDQPERAGPLWPALSSLLRKNPADRPDAAEAARALRQVADTAGTENARLPATLTIPLTTAALAGQGDDPTSELEPARAAGGPESPTAAPLAAGPPEAPLPEARPPEAPPPEAPPPQAPPPERRRPAAELPSRSPVSSGPEDPLVPGLQPRPARARPPRARPPRARPPRARPPRAGQHPVRSRSAALLRRRPQAAKIIAGILGVIVVAALAFLVSHSVAARSEPGASSAASTPPASGSGSSPPASGRQASQGPSGPASTHSGAAARRLRHRRHRRHRARSADTGCSVGRVRPVRRPQRLLHRQAGGMAGQPQRSPRLHPAPGWRDVPAH